MILCLMYALLSVHPVAEGFRGVSQTLSELINPSHVRRDSIPIRHFV